MTSDQETNLSLLRQKAKEKGITMEDVRETLREERPKVYKEVYGEN